MQKRDINNLSFVIPGPGRIVSEFVNGKEPGAYQICVENAERYDFNDPRYFVKHPMLSWVQTTAPEAKYLPGVIKTGDMQFMIGRYNYITPNGTFQTIGKLQDTDFVFFQPGDNGYTVTRGAFEVLTCQPKEPVLQCGTLLQFTVNNITELGFNSGTFYDGSTIYAGSGNLASCWGQNPR